MSFYTKKQYEQPTMDTKKLRGIVDSFYSGCYRNCDELASEECVTIDNYTLSFVEDFGGEGMGDSAWVVYKLVNNNDLTASYIRYDGYYSSYDGTDWEEWDGFRVVEPVDVMITEYHTVKELN